MFPIPFNFPFIKKNGERTTIGDAINAGGGGSQYTLPTASAETKGGVKIGSGLTMTNEVLSNNNPTPYSLPTASDSTLGGVKVGSGLSITDGVLSASGGGGGGYVDIDTYQAYDAGASSLKFASLSTLISESDYNTYLSGKIISAINVIDNPKVHLFGVSGDTYSNTKIMWYADSPANLVSGTTLRIFFV